MYILYFTQVIFFHVQRIYTEREKGIVPTEKLHLCLLINLRNDGKRGPHYTVRVALSVMVHRLLGNGAGGRHLFPTTGHVFGVLLLRHFQGAHAPGLNFALYHECRSCKY